MYSKNKIKINAGHTNAGPVRVDDDIRQEAVKFRFRSRLSSVKRKKRKNSTRHIEKLTDTNVHMQCSLCAAVTQMQVISFLQWTKSHRYSTINDNNNNNNNNNNKLWQCLWCCHHDIVIARVHRVHLMNADWAPGGRQPSDQTNRFGLWVRRSAAIIHRHHRHLLLLLSS